MITTDSIIRDPTKWWALYIWYITDCIQQLFHVVAYNIYIFLNLKSEFQVYFAATDMVLDNNDIIDSSEVDAEILGTGVLMAFVLVTML
jgi:hypothetical protein